MLKFLVASATTLLALTMSVVPAGAAGAFTFTTHITEIHDVIPATCAGGFTGATLVNGTGNGVEHGTVNSTGDWFTSTFEGQGTVQEVTGPPSKPVFGPVFQGHIQEWVGAEDNNQNNVFHATFNFKGNNVAAPFQALSEHINVDFTVNANQVPTATHFDVRCS